MRNPTHQLAPDPMPVVAMRTVMVEARRNPWLASLLLNRPNELRRRFAQFSRELLDLPRRTRRRLAKLWAMSLPMAALLLALSGGTAQAATITIGVGGCNTLVDAITAANTGGTVNGCTGSGGADTIVLGGGTYTYTTVDNSSGGDNALPLVSTDITIEGNGATIERDTVAVPTFRLLNVSGGGTLTLRDSIVQGGIADDASFGIYGGGIRNSGTVNLEGVTIQGNSAGRGGGLANTFSTATATITDSTIQNNTAGAAGGGILNRDAVTVIEESTVSGNSAGVEGGGVQNTNSSLTIDRSTISGNRNGSQCGGLSNTGTATITNSTISGNSAANGGAVCGFNLSSTTLINATITGNTANANPGIRLYQSSSVTLANSIVAGQIGGVNCLIGGGTSITSGGNNLASDGSCNLTMGSDKPNNPNANLGPLQDNGGLTETHALGVGSDALEMASDAVCAAAPINGVDQRGVSRPQPAAGSCDIGAFEALQHRLEVQRTGTGSGQVSSNPGGIQCGGGSSDCEETYPEGTVVMLSAVANAISDFQGWDPTSDPDCQDGQVTVDADKLCIAVFGRDPTAVTVTNLRADVDPTGRVVVAWETASEVDFLGFHVHRASEPGGPYARINRTMIPARGGAAVGAQYQWVDNPGVGAHLYRLEAVDQNGKPGASDTFGPRAVLVRALRLFLPWAGWGD